MKIVKTAYITIWEKENILHCVFADHLEMDINIARQCVEERIKFSEGFSFPCLIDMRGIKSVTKEARDYMGTKGAEGIKAGALIIGSPLTRVLGNIFLAVNKPLVPTRLFTEEKAALEWLNLFS